MSPINKSRVNKVICTSGILTFDKIIQLMVLFVARFPNKVSSAVPMLILALNNLYRGDREVLCKLRHESERDLGWEFIISGRFSFNFLFFFCFLLFFFFFISLALNFGGTPFLQHRNSLVNNNSKTELESFEPPPEGFCRFLSHNC